MNVAYVVSRFPHLPETFILREMQELERAGVAVHLFPLVLQDQAVIHPEAATWIPRAQTHRYLSRQVLGPAFEAAWRRPVRFWRSAVGALAGNVRSPKFLSRALAIVPKAAGVARAMREQGVTHVHTHYGTHPALLAWLVHQLEGIPYSVTVHAHDIFVDTSMLGTKLHDAAFVVAISEYNKRHLETLLGPSIVAKTHVVRCGIRPEWYGAGDPPPTDHLRLTSIGSLQPYKGQTHLLQACSILRDRGRLFRCRIVGDGPLRKRLEAEIRSLRLEGRVELLGALPEHDVASLLRDTDVYVQPSIVTKTGKMEGIPVALMEAMASNVPVVASHLSGIPELVRNEQTGLTVRPEDPQALAEAILRLADDPATSHRIAAAGRTLVQREYDLRNNVDRLASLFRASAVRNRGEVVAGRAARPSTKHEPRISPALGEEG